MRKILLLVCVVLSTFAVKSEAATCGKNYSDCSRYCQAGGALCHAGATGSDLCDTSETLCEEQCTDAYNLCANGEKPAV